VNLMYELECIIVWLKKGNTLGGAMVARPYVVGEPKGESTVRERISSPTMPQGPPRRR